MLKFYLKLNIKCYWKLYLFLIIKILVFKNKLIEIINICIAKNINSMKSFINIFFLIIIYKLEDFLIWYNDFIAYFFVYRFIET